MLEVFAIASVAAWIGIAAVDFRRWSFDRHCREALAVFG